MPATLGLGTATFLASYGLAAGPPPGDELVRAAFRAGIRYYDTAAAYGDGEIAVGRSLAGRDARVCTKIRVNGAMEDVRASVKHLCGAPDTILMHSAGHDQLTGASAIDALVRAKAQGLTKRIGASTYGADDALFALAQPWVDTVQIEYSILNQSVMRQIAAAKAKRADQELIARSVLCKGLLTSRREAARDLAAPLEDALNETERCARDWNHTMESLAIRFALDTPGIDVVLVGVSTEAELTVAVRAARREPLSAEQWQALAALDRSALDATHPERWDAARA